MFAFAALLAHQGGWDEFLLVAGPIIVIVGLLALAKRRVDRIGAAGTAAAAFRRLGRASDQAEPPRSMSAPTARSRPTRSSYPRSMWCTPVIVVVPSAWLAAEGETMISGVHHIEGGYDDLVGRLARRRARIDT